MIAADDRLDVTRRVALEAFGPIEAEHEAATPGLPYQEVLRRTHRDLAAAFAMESHPGIEDAFAASLPMCPPFPMAQMPCAPCTTASGWSSSPTSPWCAPQTRSGRTSPIAPTFEHLLARREAELGAGPGDVLHTAQSVYRDLVPAASLGLATAWIDRQRLVRGGHRGATKPVPERT